jgi:hypothetical protein
VNPARRGTPKEKLPLADAESARLCARAYRMGALDGVTADIIVGHTVCATHGLVSAAQFRRLAHSLRPA